ncbi:MAG: hypothetical protein ABI442_20165 [Gemmatimonadaceae bacterium]
MRRSIALLMSSLRVAALVTPFIAGAAGAQVGYIPARSPYLDLEQAQELTLIVGTYHGHKDVAGVAPQGGTLIGAHYEWRAGGPAHLIAEVAGVNSNSLVLNPFKSGAARDLGNLSRPLYTADFDLGLSLTGAKSWHHLVPEVQGGVGLISDFRSQPDTGGFKFGTRFSFNVGAGIRYVPGERWAFRVDLKDRLYTIGYPESYYVAPAGGTSIIPSSQAKSFWTNNPALTIGISRLF